MISYSTNWMGPIDMGWYERNGVDYEKVKYSGGRIDIRDDTKEGYDGWDEYSLAPMRTEDWNALSNWLYTVNTNTQWCYNDLIANFERFYGKPIRWADDIWYTCHECGLVTDLRESTEHIHKMDCTRKWDKE